MNPTTDPTAATFPLELVRKYNRPGPRYTSYPTAPHFDAASGPADFLTEIRRTKVAGSGGGLSLYVHLPFCRLLCHYCACHMLVTHRPEKVARYLEYLEREIDLVSREVAPGRKVVQVHWGGGTPTYLAPDEIERLMAHLASRFELAPDAEVSIEADPRGLTEAHLEAARRAGLNRISFGVQDFDARVQEAINRIQPEELVAAATKTARRLGFNGINYDLIYGLPHQTLASFEETVRRAIALAFDDYFAADLAALAPLAEDGLVRLPAETIEVSGWGRYFIRNIAMAFDANLGRRSAGEAPRHAQAV